jgi:BON domain-containing protein/double zinc ribbon protein
MICEKCQTAIAEGKKFCGQCGTPVRSEGNNSSPSSCPGCGRELIPGKKFCGACGRQVLTTMEEQRTVAPRPALSKDPVPKPGPRIDTYSEQKKAGFTNVQTNTTSVTAMESRQNWMPIVIIVVLVGVGVYLAVHLLSSHPQTAQQTTSSSESSSTRSQTNAPVGDNELLTDVQSSLQEESALANEPIRVKVIKGRVILLGSVSNPSARALAERKVNQVKGVVTLIDNLIVRPVRRYELIWIERGRQRACCRRVGELVRK